MVAAAVNKNPEIVTALVNNGAEVNETNSPKLGMTALMIAAEFNDNPDVITALINNGADVNMTTPATDRTALYYAEKNKNPEVAAVLRKHYS